MLALFDARFHKNIHAECLTSLLYPTNKWRALYRCEDKLEQPALDRSLKLQFFSRETCVAPATMETEDVY
jgi:hypothetical protein